MPELPEVETIRRGLAPRVEGRRIVDVTVRERRLRWPVERDLEVALVGRSVQALQRRAKYLLWRVDDATLLVHLGMSGALRLVEAGSPPHKHDHIDLHVEDGSVVRFSDPRRFGAWILAPGDASEHPLLRDLGPEPLGPDFDGELLWQALRRRRCAIKLALMDSHVVVGAGNIYANEALFAAGIRPTNPAFSLSRPRVDRLAQALKRVLARAVQEGGTTLRDGGFVNSAGQPGYFQQTLSVYDRAAQPCVRCKRAIRVISLAQRSTYYCPRCQR
ncbi:MAG: bifunctional DNA-formamidopyrimidine glycosylase/DNA-(apurinic or apyrimidinic site) lyase [Pseudomonadota bacterium]